MNLLPQKFQRLRDAFFAPSFGHHGNTLTPRLDGDPRRWQIERARRRGGKNA